MSFESEGGKRGMLVLCGELFSYTYSYPPANTHTHADAHTSSSPSFTQLSTQPMYRNAAIGDPLLGAHQGYTQSLIKGTPDYKAYTFKVNRITPIRFNSMYGPECDPPARANPIACHL
jgi:hypothetical protein